MTEGALAYFDGLWGKVKESKFEYRTQTAIDVMVKQGDSVCKGDPLFSYMTEKGVKTLYADAEGTIEYLSNDREFYMHLAKHNNGRFGISLCDF